MRRCCGCHDALGCRCSSFLISCINLACTLGAALRVNPSVWLRRNTKRSFLRKLAMRTMWRGGKSTWQLVTSHTATFLALSPMSFMLQRPTEVRTGSRQNSFTTVGIMRLRGKRQALVGVGPHLKKIWATLTYLTTSYQHVSMPCGSVALFCCASSLWQFQSSQGALESWPC